MLALRFEGLLASGAVRDQAEFAAVAGVTRARVTQILKLQHLAPDVQETVLHLPRTLSGRDLITECRLRSIAVDPLWPAQRDRWQRAGAGRVD